MFSLFGIAFVAIVIGIFLAVLVTRQKTPDNLPLVPPEEDYDIDPKDAPALTLSDLFKLGEAMCKQHSLTVKERLSQSPLEVYWIAESTNEFFFGNYVLGFVEVDAERPFVTMHDILEFKDFIKSVSSTKGFFFNTGYYTRDVHQPLEGPKVTLYNRRKILDELRTHHLA